ncbi:MAG: NAD(P)-binding domain-containing protein, partial [Geminicoccaceae bacterium]
MSSVSVVGAGAWGTALALQALRAGQAVTLVVRDTAKVGQMRRERVNPHLPAAVLPEALHITDTIPLATSLILLAVPTQYIRGTMPRIAGSAPVVICAKGVEIGSHRLPLEVVADCLPPRPLAVLTGPNFAHEIAAGLPAASVVASTDPELREQVRQAL